MWMLHDVVLIICQLRATLYLAMYTSSISSTHLVATHRNSECDQMFSTLCDMLQSFGQDWKCWANNVVIWCNDMLQLFGQGLRLSSYCFVSVSWCKIYSYKNTPLARKRSRQKIHVYVLYVYVFNIWTGIDTSIPYKFDELIDWLRLL